MKAYSIVLVILLLCLNSLWANDFRQELTLPYRINSETFSKDIPSGHFMLKGKVYFNQSDTTTNIAFISNASQDRVAWNEDGGAYYEGVFSVADTLIYCVSLGFQEVVIQGPFKDQHLIDLDIYMTNVVNATYLKPVIYAYQAPENFALNIKPCGEFTFTYPHAADGEWSLQTNDDGTLTDQKEQKKYPYIFWEGQGSGHTLIKEGNQIEGYLIKTDTCILFLERTLGAFGFNARETTDFITFWGPKMIESPYALVQFLTLEMYGQKIAQLTVKPHPETLLRVYMYLVPLQAQHVDFIIVPPVIDKIERHGFTVIEWGGSILPVDMNLN